jgi:hypothetical protein
LAAKKKEKRKEQKGSRQCGVEEALEFTCWPNCLLI